MSSQPAYLTPAEYLDIERKADFKSEYYHGEMFAMAGGSDDHAAIAGNIVTALNNLLGGKPCRVYGSDMRLKAAAEVYTYPDVTVVCGERKFADGRRDVILNPVAIFEVLSPSTKNYDLGEKFEHYRSIPSLFEYLTVSQDRPAVDQRTRQADGWLVKSYNDLTQTVDLISLGISLPLAAIYNKIDFAD